MAPGIDKRIDTDDAVPMTFKRMAHLSTVVAVAAALAACSNATAAPVAKPATVQAAVTPAPVETVSEDSPEWNCLTMGNKVCGSAWVPVPAAAYADLGASKGAVCVMLVGDTTVVACDDGQVFSS